MYHERQVESQQGFRAWSAALDAGLARDAANVQLFLNVFLFFVIVLFSIIGGLAAVNLLKRPEAVGASDKPATAQGSPLMSDEPGG